MKFSKKPFIKHIILFLLVCMIAIFFYIQNNFIEITKISYQNSEIPLEFDGFQILHISDLHNKEFGENQKTLIKDIKHISPDVIVITGDLIDRRRTDENDMSISLSLVEQAVQIAPVYFVTGNHESRSDVYELLKEDLINLGVKILENASVRLNKASSSITLIGLQDLFFHDTFEKFERELESLTKENPDSFNILLTHRPELIDTYSNTNVDLIFSGHAHGGQIRLPFIGGVIAPGQGLFPKYTSGIYYEENTALIVSRGLGNSLFPVRVLNRPELIVLTLESEQM